MRVGLFYGGTVAHAEYLFVVGYRHPSLLTGTVICPAGSRLVSPRRLLVPTAGGMKAFFPKDAYKCGRKHLFGLEFEWAN